MSVSLGWGLAGGVFNRAALSEVIIDGQSRLSASVLTAREYGCFAELMRDGGTAKSLAEELQKEDTVGNGYLGMDPMARGNREPLGGWDALCWRISFLSGTVLLQATTPIRGIR